MIHHAILFGDYHAIYEQLEQWIITGFTQKSTLCGLYLVQKSQELARLGPGQCRLDGRERFVSLSVEVF